MHLTKETCRTILDMYAARIEQNLNITDEMLELTEYVANCVLTTIDKKMQPRIIDRFEHDKTINEIANENHAPYQSVSNTILSYAYRVGNNVRARFETPDSIDAVFPEMPVRLNHTLWRNQICTVEQISQLTEDTLVKLHGITKNGVLYNQAKKYIEKAKARKEKI